MRLLHVSDLHFRKPWFEWITSHARDYDAVCLAGDLLNLFGTQQISLRAQARWTRDWLREFPGRLFVCTGNHDCWDSKGIVDTDAHGGWLDKMRRPTVTVDGHSAECGGMHIYCHAFRAPPVWPAFPTARWILLHHIPPALTATAISGGGGTLGGSRELAAALTTTAFPPWLVLSGHIHKPKSWRGKCGPSWSFNPTYDEQATFPNHIVIDTDSGVVTWIAERAGTWPVKAL